jgi:hypothetical protein
MQTESDSILGATIAVIGTILGSELDFLVISSSRSRRIICCQDRQQPRESGRAKSHFRLFPG